MKVPIYRNARNGTKQRDNGWKELIETPEVYPTGGSVANICRWLNRKYFIGIHIATTCLALGCAEVGEGEAAIRLLNRAAQHWEQRRNYVEEKVMVWSSRGKNHGMVGSDDPKVSQRSRGKS